ncbi:hypothetical protein SLEP1_g24558 [Rubroshorea leprosula]|uniref:Uncharacterized protein n=1 Tax=Rubroshorea leprosula TaxID=152421 RepID=A0AAV5JPU1_9ROSI|nr:hypothetical protein SLEP1_g24558 [Rubroshorea leprosula]
MKLIQLCATTSIHSSTKLAVAEADSLMIEIDNDVLESEESIDAATHLLLELLNGNPFELCQVIDQNEALNAAEVLSKAPTLDASVRVFWSYFPTVYKNFSQRFMNEEKVVSSASAAIDLARQRKEVVEKKKSIYEKVRNSISTQMKLHQDNLDEIAKLEARLVELKKTTTKEEDNLKSLKAKRSKLLVKLKEDGREALAAKSEAAQQEEKAKETNNTLQQMRDEWAT